MRVFTPRSALACYLILLAAYLVGAIVPLLDGASADYANIALAIHEEGNWKQFMLQGQDYQGGPPLLFWLAALSFELFGVSEVAYKLPSLLFSVLAIYSVVRLGSLLYNETVGRLAGVILASAFAFLLANNDANMDALLIGSVAFATCQLFIFVTDEHKLSARAHLVVAGVGLALGFAARGLIGVAVPLFAVFLYLVYRLEWRRIFDPFWLVLPPLVLLFISPVLYAYHSQFGLDGLMKFVLWMQSAEHSASGSQPGGGIGEIFFYYYTYLWAFLPWTAFALWALASGALKLTNDRYWPRARGYAVTLGVVVSAFILLSVARFNLQHYVSVLLPFFALLVAGWLPARLRHPVYQYMLWRVQYVVLAVVLITALVINGWMFPMQDWLVGVVMVATVLVLGIWVIPSWSGGNRLVIVSVSVSAAFWLLANTNLLKLLPEYQAGTALGNVVMARQLDKTGDVYYLDGGGWAASFNVALRRRPQTLTLEELVARNKPALLFITAKGDKGDEIDEIYGMIRAKGLSTDDVRGQSTDYGISVTHFNWDFINPNTRHAQWREATLLYINPQ
ncbi:MAG: glycosyltransferase family 39 protein [Betaproteobacteria bacterium]|nr:glycosyltransferase family 39 protein [Betaproteobacteria bacterium]